MPDVTTSVTRPTTPASEPAAAVTGENKVASVADAAEVFWIASRLCQALFSVLGEVGKFLNQALEKTIADLRLRTSAQALFLNSGPPNNGTITKDEQKFPLGGTDASGDTSNPVSTKRANDLLDYLHSFGLALEFPAWFAKDPSKKVLNESREVPLGDYKKWQTDLTNQIERIKNDSQVESTKAKGTLDSSSAAIDLATAIIKIQVSNAQSAASALKM
nr:hypothetical protein [uncultured Noviherbaspirillum sp.]